MDTADLHSREVIEDITHGALSEGLFILLDGLLLVKL